MLEWMISLHKLLSLGTVTILFS